jgi:hypothetical protein
MSQGYLIVKKPLVSLKRYESSCVAARNRDFLEQMRSAFARFPPEKYRGIARFPLDGCSWDDPAAVKALEDSGVDMRSNRNARARLDESLDKSDDLDDICLVPHIEDALHIHGLLDQPDSWEIIQIRRDEFQTGPTTLGFDIGYWGGDHFSIIADTIVTPMWHPPIPEDFAELIRQFSGLNQHLLFSRPQDAEEFRAYYRSKTWAETECGESDFFCIIQVDLVPPSPTAKPRIS